MPATFVIFGASGDLTSRKLIPALYKLFCKKRLRDGLRVIGFSRSPFSHDQWRNELAASTAKFAGEDFDRGVWDQFAANLYYHAGDIGEAADFGGLRDLLAEIENGAAGTRVYYLATAPTFYEAALSRKRDCSELTRLAIRKHNFRAGVESELHRPCADHRG
jgi:glucose-6-phosphate 1-dehydrogenase